MAAFHFITMPIILPITCDFFYKNNFEDNVTKYNQKSNWEIQIQHPIILCNFELRNF